MVYLLTLLLFRELGSLCDVEVKELECDIVVSEYELKSHSYVQLPSWQGL